MDEDDTGVASLNDIPHHKKPWVKAEDDILTSLVTQYGAQDWFNIAFEMASRGFVRTGKQCRERWLNQLSPEVRKDSWTEEEDRIILDAHSRLGNKWVAISKLLEGRPANAVKNRWNSTLHRRFSNGSDMGSPYSPSDSPDSSFRKRKRAKRPSGDDDDDYDDTLQEKEPALSNRPKKSTSAVAASRNRRMSPPMRPIATDRDPTTISSISLSDSARSPSPPSSAGSSPALSRLVDSVGSNSSLNGSGNMTLPPLSTLTAGVPCMVQHPGMQPGGWFPMQGSPMWVPSMSVANTALNMTQGFQQQYPDYSGQAGAPAMFIPPWGYVPQPMYTNQNTPFPPQFHGQVTTLQPPSQASHQPGTRPSADGSNPLDIFVRAAESLSKPASAVAGSLSK